jgi:hypothetical protein
VAALNLQLILVTRYRRRRLTASTWAPLARHSPAWVPTSAPSWTVRTITSTCSSPPRRRSRVTWLVISLKGVSARRLRQRYRVRTHREHLWLPS